MTNAYKLKNKIENWVETNYGTEELENPSWDINGLVEELCQDDLEYVGSVSVDSGMLMVADPCYWIKGKDSMEWIDYCKSVGVQPQKCFEHEHGVPGKGVMLGHFGGDGIYPVYAEYDKDGLQKQIVIKLR